MNKGALIAVISSIVILLDYLTKKIIVTKVMLYESINVLPFLNIVHVQNKGLHLVSYLIWVINILLAYR